MTNLNKEPEQEKDLFICVSCKTTGHWDIDTRITNSGEYLNGEWLFHIACDRCLKVYLTIRKHLTSVKEYQRDIERAI